MKNYSINSDYYNYINNNYNIPTYEQDVIKNSVFDPYDGFIHGNMFPDLYNSYKVDNPYQIIPANKQAEMLTSIDSLSFACTDLGLYLDVNPDDRDALVLYNQYRSMLNKYMDMYQKQYCPIDMMSDSLNNYPWMWNKMPWPWEKGV